MTLRLSTLRPLTLWPSTLRLSTPRLWLTAAALVLATSLPSLADAQQLSPKELKKIERQASKAVAAGQIDQAHELYQQILDGLPAGDARRGDALYAIGLRKLAPASPHHNVNHGFQHLEELAASNPNHARRAELAVIRALVNQARTAESQLLSCSTELDQERAELATQLQEAEASKADIADETKAADGRVKSLEAQLRKARSELAETKSELEKKEEALQKLKDALVGRAGVSGG